MRKGKGGGEILIRRPLTDTEYKVRIWRNKVRNIKILWIKASESYLVVTLLKLQNNSLVSP